MRILRKTSLIYINPIQTKMRMSSNNSLLRMCFHYVPVDVGDIGRLYSGPFTIVEETTLTLHTMNAFFCPFLLYADTVGRSYFLMSHLHCVARKATLSYLMSLLLQSYYIFTPLPHLRLDIFKKIHVHTIMSFLLHQWECILMLLWLMVVLMYVYDADHELQNRLAENITLDPQVLALLKSILDNHNAFAQVLRRISLMENVNDIRLQLKERRPDQPQYNLPTASQVAAILIGGDDPSDLCERDIIIQTQGGNLFNVPDTTGFYDPLQYPLLHPYGQFGWDVQLHNQFAGSTLSCRAYYCYMLQIRPAQKSLLLNSRRLLQQYAVDTYVKISTQQLRYIRDNQVKLRAELYQGLRDSVANGETCTSNVGRRVILPASYIGSPRDMHER